MSEHTDKNNEHSHEHSHEDLHRILERKYQEYQIVEEHLQKLNKQLQNLEDRSMEAKVIVSALDELNNSENGSEILVPLSNGIFVKAKLSKSNEFLVNVGSDVVVPKSFEDTKSMIESQDREIEKYRNNLYEQVSLVTDQLRVLEEELSSIEQSHQH